APAAGHLAGQSPGTGRSVLSCGAHPALGGRLRPARGRMTLPASISCLLVGYSPSRFGPQFSPSFVRAGGGPSPPRRATAFGRPTPPAPGESAAQRSLI